MFLIGVDSMCRLKAQKSYKPTCPNHNTFALPGRMCFSSFFYPGLGSDWAFSPLIDVETMNIKLCTLLIDTRL